MRKYLISVLFILYLIFFGLFAISADVASVSAKNCWSNWYNQSNRDAAPGTLKCDPDPPWTQTIVECQDDGTWKEYWNCQKESPPVYCQEVSNSARCVGMAAAPTPTLTPTPTQTPTPLPVPKCVGVDGLYSPKEQQCSTPYQMQLCTLQADKTVKWVDGDRCVSGTCRVQGTEPNRTTICNYTEPTVTPDPDPKCSTFDPDNGAVVKLDIGAKICANYGPTQPTSDVQECQLKNNVGELVKIGTCQGYTVCHSDAPLGDGYECKNAIGEDKFQPLENVDPSCIQSDKPAQQLIPQPGVNCGKGAATGVDTLETACCYSSAADMEVPPLSCIINLGGGKDLLNSISNKINDIIDCLPDLHATNCALSEDQYKFNVANIKKALKKVPLCEPKSLPVPGTESLAGQDNNGTPLCTCELRPSTTNSAQMCYNISKTDSMGNIVPDVNEQTACLSCMQAADGSQGKGIWTAIGCIDISSENGVIQSLFRVGIGIAGAIAVLCNMYAAFMFQTSRGNPEGIKKAQDLITSCITGLLLIIFSVFILRLIGYSILRIPGFG